jgi:hypothetical protein
MAPVNWYNLVAMVHFVRYPFVITPVVFGDLSKVSYTFAGGMIWDLVVLIQYLHVRSRLQQKNLFLFFQHRGNYFFK